MAGFVKPDGRTRTKRKKPKVVLKRHPNEGAFGTTHAYTVHVGKERVGDLFYKKDVKRYPHTPAPTIQIHKKHQGKGYGTEALRQGNRKSGSTVAAVHKTNGASIGMLTKLGYSRDVPKKKLDRAFEAGHGVQVYKKK